MPDNTDPNTFVFRNTTVGKFLNRPKPAKKPKIGKKPLNDKAYRKFATRLPAAPLKKPKTSGVKKVSTSAPKASTKINKNKKSTNVQKLAAGKKILKAQRQVKKDIKKENKAGQKLSIQEARIKRNNRIINKKS